MPSKLSDLNRMYVFKERSDIPYLSLDVTEFDDALLWKSLKYEYCRARDYGKKCSRLVFHFNTMKNLSKRGKRIIKELYARELYTYKGLTKKLLRIPVL